VVCLGKYTSYNTTVKTIAETLDMSRAVFRFKVKKMGLNI